MWKYNLLNKLFGWEYAMVYSNNYAEVCKFIPLPNGNLIGRFRGKPCKILTDGKIESNKSVSYDPVHYDPLTWDNRLPEEMQPKKSILMEINDEHT